MFRDKSRPRADVPAWSRLRLAISVEPRVVAFIMSVMAVVAAAVWVTVQLLRPVPVLTFTAWPAPMSVLPGAAPHPAWPGGGVEAAVGLSGAGILATHGGDRAVPIASLAKIMTAYEVLHDHPLAAHANGPRIAVTRADVTTYARDKSQGQSVAKVAAGEKLTERQALEAMLIPSGNNIATLLARWDAGSRSAFVSRMNARARSLGLSHTHYVTPSGFDPGTVSTPADQLRLTLRALGLPAFRSIVAMPQVTLPVAGLLYNTNYALGHGGIIGVKTGTSPQAGACLVFAAPRTVAGRKVTIVGAVLGVRATAAQPSELDGVIAASERLLGSVSGHIERVEVVKPGTVLGVVHSEWTGRQAAVVTSGVSVTGWAGMPVRVRVVPLTLSRTLRPGQAVAKATVSVNGAVSRLTLRADGTVRQPSLAWRLTR